MIGDYVVIARQQRGAADWYLGATTDENARKLDHPARLPRARQDATKRRSIATRPDADYLTNPTALVIEKRRVTSKDRIEAVAGGRRWAGGALPARS